MLAARFKRPKPILAGILAATLLNHGLASALGAWITTVIDAEVLRWILGISFLGMAAWTWIPDEFEQGESRKETRFGVFGVTLATFFLAEMGDKTQLATVAMAANFGAPLVVALGTTAGMMLADAPAVLTGDKLAEKIPIRLVRGIASALFALLGIAALLGFGGRLGF